ncbi:MAG: putative sugar O-methyltransferase [Candidatus Niyogibacteria bacterium]|nr:putative sugar O-methyltransferase [Candidatus Niyogibacteria bacterium]
MDPRFAKLKAYLTICPQSKKLSYFWQNRIPLYQFDVSGADWLSRIKKKVRGQEGNDTFGFADRRTFFLFDYIRFFLLRLQARYARMKRALFGEWHDENVRALYFLWSRGVYKEYQDFIHSLDIAATFPSSRYFWYLKFLELKSKRFMPQEPMNIFEIGAGAGGFAIFCFRKFPIARYVIIDLPEMLGHAAYQFITYTDKKIIYPHEIKDFDQINTVYLLTPDQSHLLPARFFHMSFNFRSFGEMKKEHIENYFHHIYRCGKANSIFYNVNHHLILKEPTGEVSNNNPLLFPYHQKDRVLYWGLDEFHHQTRTIVGLRKPTMTILRLAVINLS